MNNRQGKRRKSIFYRLTLTIFLVAVAQTLLIGSALLFSRVIPNLEDNAYEILSQTVSNRRNYVESEMHNRWSAIDDFIPRLVNLHPAAESEQTELNEEQILSYLDKSIPVLISMLRDTATTGSFIILDDNDGKNVFSCLYFKDYDPNFNDLQNNSDLLILKGPLEFLSMHKIPLDVSWNYAITLTDDNLDMFYKPYEAAKTIKEYRLLGYWDISTSLYDKNIKVITYTKPLINNKGKVMGVVGIEISQDYLYKLLPERELSDTDFNGYAIIASDKNGGYVPVMTQGANLKSILPYGKTIQIKPVNETYAGYELKAASIPLAANFAEITLYNRNTPFNDIEWYLLGVTEKNTLIKSAKSLQHTLFIIIPCSLFVGFCIAYFLGVSFTTPITGLVKRIRLIEPGRKVVLGKTGISEIDELSAAIEQLNDDVLNSLLKTDKIIDMVELDIGSFEHRADSSFVQISKTLAEILDLQISDFENLRINSNEFYNILDDIKSRKTAENVYQYSANPPKWLKIESIKSKAGEFGIVIDVTAEELSKQALMFERDYDSLTRIFNRYAFQREFIKLCSTGNLKTAAFFMCDLDNLKYVNDTYGHDTGDLYIRSAARLLSIHLAEKSAIVGRMSGDEFYAFIYGYANEDEIRQLINDFYKVLATEYILLPSGHKFKLKMSSGIAWYGKDSTDPAELLRFADFAMYQGKNTVKGGIREFNKALYLAGSYMIMGKEELYSIFDEQLIDYVFQPIVKTDDGSIYGYEALMRPQGKTVNSPDKLIQLAAAQGQLWRVEKITFFMVLELYKKHRDMFNGSRIFINSVPNQTLKDEEYEEIQHLYGDFLNCVVIEITESESINNVQLAKKKELIAAWNSLLALDDYGSGYANDISLITLRPDIIKIDRFLVDGVEASTDKQAIINKTITFARERNILVLAEGVETQAQLEKLVKMGVDLLQGYFVCKPQPLPQFNTKRIQGILQSIT